MKRLSFKSAALLAVTALLLGVLSCRKDEPTDPEDPTNTEEPTDDTGTTDDGSDCTFDLVVTSTTYESVSYTVTPSVSTVGYYLAVLDKETYGTADAQGLIDGVVAQAQSDAAAAGFDSNDYNSYLTLSLEYGEYSGTVSGLSAETEYLLVALGFSSDGTVLTQPGYVEFTTPEDPYKLTFTLEVTDITTSSATIKVTPSDLTAEYIFLCQAASAYPNLDESDPNAIAQAYVDAYGYFYEAGMGLLYTGEYYTYPSLMKGTKYYLFAFGYTRGVGITSDCYLVSFTTEQGTLPEDFSAVVDVTDVTSSVVRFTVTPADDHNDTYYGVVAYPTSEYNEATVISEVEVDIQYAQNQQHQYGFTAYSIVDAVEDVCYLGTNSYSASALTPETEYTIAVVAVNNEGKGVKVLTTTATTVAENYGNATCTAELVAVFDGHEVINSGYVDVPSSMSYYVNQGALAVYKLTPSEDAAEYWYYMITGDYSDPDAENCDDDYIHDYIADSEYRVQHFYQAEEGQEYVFEIVKFVYGYDLPTTPSHQYGSPCTFLTIAKDSEDTWGRFSRLYTESFKYNERTDIEELATLVELIGGKDKVVIRDNNL